MIVVFSGRSDVGYGSWLRLDDHVLNWSISPEPFSHPVRPLITDHLLLMTIPNYKIWDEVISRVYRFPARLQRFSEGVQDLF